MRFQAGVESGEQTVVGVNKYQIDEDPRARAALERPSRESIESQLASLARFKRIRNNDAVRRALDELARAAADNKQNVYAAVVEAVVAGATHGEVVARLRLEMGDGQPLIVP